MKLGIAIGDPLLLCHESSFSGCQASSRRSC
jgi:hypothetical protein